MGEPNLKQRQRQNILRLALELDGHGRLVAIGSESDPANVEAKTVSTMSRLRKGMDRMTITNAGTTEMTLRDAHAAAEREHEKAAEAAARASAAAARAASVAAELERERQIAREGWAQRVVGNYPTTSAAAIEAVGAAQQAFEAAIVTDPATMITRYIEMLKAQAEQHAEREAYIEASGVLGNHAPGNRRPEFPRPSLVPDIQAVLARHVNVMIDTEMGAWRNARDRELGYAGDE